MGVQRFQSTGVSVATLQTLVEPGLTASSQSFPVYIDITLTDDSLLPDLQVVMGQMGWSFVGSAPTTPLPTISTTEIEVDFGAAPVSGATFVIAFAQALPTSRITAVLSGNAGTGRALGDAAWDGVSFAAEPGTGTYNLYALCTTGTLVGTRKVVVTINNT